MPPPEQLLFRRSHQKRVREHHRTPRRGADGATFFGWQKSPIIFCVRVFVALELFHFITTLKLPLSRAKPAAAGTPDRDIRAPQGDSSSRFLGGFFGLGKDLCLYKPQVQRGFSFLNGRSAKGAGQHSAPPRLCLSQLLGRSTFPHSH